MPDGRSQSESRAGRARMFPSRMAIPQERREILVRELNQRLADSLDLFTQAKQAHWNVKGMNFYQLHLLFDELAEMVEGHVDLIAERATALGGIAMGTVRMAAQNSALPEFPQDADERAILETLVERFASHGEHLRQSIAEAEEQEDAATADLFTEIVRDIDKGLYMLESHLQGGVGR